MRTALLTVANPGIAVRNRAVIQDLSFKIDSGDCLVLGELVEAGGGLVKSKTFGLPTSVKEMSAF
jgi:hypothetical protein